MQSLTDGTARVKDVAKDWLCGAGGRCRIPIHPSGSDRGQIVCRALSARVAPPQHEVTSGGSSPEVELEAGFVPSDPLARVNVCRHHLFCLLLSLRQKLRPVDFSEPGIVQGQALEVHLHTNTAILSLRGRVRLRGRFKSDA